MLLKKICSLFLIFFFTLGCCLFVPLSFTADAMTFFMPPFQSFGLMSTSNDENFEILSEDVVFNISEFDGSIYTSNAFLKATYRIKNKGNAASTKMALPYVEKPSSPQFITVSSTNGTIIPISVYYAEKYFDDIIQEDLYAQKFDTVELNGNGTLYTFTPDTTKSFSVTIPRVQNQAVLHSGYNSFKSDKDTMTLLLNTPIDKYQLFISGELSSEPISETPYTKETISYEDYFNSIYQLFEEADEYQFAPRNFYWEIFAQSINQGKMLDIIDELLNAGESPFLCFAVFDLTLSQDEEITLFIKSKLHIRGNSAFKPPIYMYRFVPSYEQIATRRYELQTSETFPYIIEHDIKIPNEGNIFSCDDGTVPPMFYAIFSTEREPIPINGDSTTNNKRKTLIIICHTSATIAGALLLFLIIFSIKKCKAK